jgi:hypothetical protein
LTSSALPVTATFLSPSKTTVRPREIVIWVTDQCKTVPASRFSTIWKFISIFRDDVPSTDISKVFVKNKIDVTSERYQQYIDADIRNILGTKKANTERSNSSPNCSTWSVTATISPSPRR